MEDEKAAALYDELTRKGGGAARFKQGLGFSSAAAAADNSVPSRGSALPAAFSSPSTFLSQFVKASSPSNAAELEKQAQLSSIQNKLKKTPQKSQIPTRIDGGGGRSSPRSRSPDGDRVSIRRSGGREKSAELERASRRRSRSRSRDRRRRSMHGASSRSRSRSRSRRSSREEHYLRRRRSRSESPRRRRRREKSHEGSSDKAAKERKGRVDYAELIEGYHKMTPAEQVKAKMKLQLSETAEKDSTMAMGSGWERFEFDKDAPLDNEEIEAVDDDAAVVKHIGQSFRFSTVEARREEEVKAAHDEAMFGASSLAPAIEADDEAEKIQEQAHESVATTSILSDQVRTMQQGSWRDHVRRS